MCSRLDDPSTYDDAVAIRRAELAADDPLRLRGYELRPDPTPCVCILPCPGHRFDWCRDPGGPDHLCDPCRAARVAALAPPEPTPLTVGLVPVRDCGDCAAAILDGPGALYAHQRADHHFRVHL